jgi:hypothetical protein
MEAESCERTEAWELKELFVDFGDDSRRNISRNTSGLRNRDGGESS